jgi:hypothetical protein
MLRAAGIAFFQTGTPVSDPQGQTPRGAPGNSKSTSNL